MGVDRWEKGGKNRKAEDTEEKSSCKVPGLRGTEMNKICLSGCSIPIQDVCEQRIPRCSRGSEEEPEACEPLWIDAHTVHTHVQPSPKSP